jgi:serine/threonine protein kinase
VHCAISIDHHVSTPSPWLGRNRDDADTVNWSQTGMGELRDDPVTMGMRVGWWVMALLLVFATVVHAQSGWSPADSIFVACGSATDVPVDGRVFLGDAGAGNAPNPKLDAPGSVVASTNLPNANLPNPKLYQQARLFTTNSSYTFKVTPGRHFLRLHFYPFTFTTFSPNTSTFSVTANQFQLLESFHPATYSTDALPLVFREYSLNVTTSTLVVTFSPESEKSSSYGFVNAVEVASMPVDVVASSALSLTQPGTVVSWGSDVTAVEMLYHVNVGGGVVLPQNDSAGMWRAWQQDDGFLVTAAEGKADSIPDAAITYPPPLQEYVAPPAVYQSARTMGISNTVNAVFNLSWAFPVAVGFTYLLRLHFCELLLNTVGQRVFNVYVNNQTADSSIDVIALTGQADFAMYRDFLVPMAADSPNLWLQIGPAPSSTSTLRDAILNGVEIWKLNSTSGSLAGTSVVAASQSTGSNISVAAIAGAGVAGVVVVALLGILIFCCCCRKKSTLPVKSRKHSAPAWLPLPGHHHSDHSKVSASSAKSGTGSYAPSTVQGTNLGRYFTFAELQEATNDFDESLILGVGGFGKVFKGEIDDGTKVAVKRGNPCSEQGLTEFQTEIELLSKLRHRHLVSLIGYCEEHCEMILVYDYMANGPLRGHLYGTDLAPLVWKQRLEICIGAARGLHYLHTGAAQGIIHRDVKTTNILLDENLVAKVADFGLSKTGPSLEQTHISTAGKGSFGYLDPEYFRRQQLTEKSDVYSFGVVLMEVLCARPAINPALAREEVNLAEWAMQKQRAGELESIMDPELVGQCGRSSVRKFGDTAEKCLQERGVDRPAMGDVLWNLELALQLHEAELAHPTHLMDASTPSMVSLMPPHDDASSVSSERHILAGSYDDDDDDDIDLEDASASAVFSQLVNPQGR